MQSGRYFSDIHLTHVSALWKWMLYRISRLAIREHKSNFNDQQLLHWAVTLWEPLSWVALYFTHIIELFDLYLFCWLFCLLPTSDACVWCWACTSSHLLPMYLLTEDGTCTLLVWACELPWGCSPGSGFCCLDTQLMVREPEDQDCLSWFWS